MDERFTALQKQIDERFTAQETHFTSLQKQLDLRFEATQTQMHGQFTAQQKQMDERFTAQDRRFDDMNRRFDKQHKLISLGFTAMTLIIAAFNLTLIMS